MLKHAILGLLAERPRHGYDLRSAFEDLLAGTWPLNSGQVYATLQRLERDGLVVVERVEQDLLPDRKVYSLTPAGWDELHAWLAEAPEDVVHLRDEFFVKMLLHARIDSGDPLKLIWDRRQRLLQTLGQLAPMRSDRTLEPAAALVAEGAALHVEADLRWLDHCESRLTQLRKRRTRR